MQSSPLIELISKKLSHCTHLNGNPTQIAWWLLEAVTGNSRAELITQKTIKLSEAQQTQLDQWLTALVDTGKPLQYVLGSVPFLDLIITVQPPILIPRPETEQWCADLITQLKTVQGPLHILDLCTGTGCIGLAVAHALPQAQVIGLDINADAVTLAQENAVRNKVHNITFLQSDLFTVLSAGTSFDLIVSNPPYVTEEEWRALESHVREWEDVHALVAPDQGLSIIRKIIEEGQSFITKNGPIADTDIPQLVLEIGSKQGAAVAAHMEQCGYQTIAVHKDQNGHDRLVTART